MALQADFGIAKPYFSGDLATLELTVNNPDGSAFNLAGVSDVIFVVAPSQGAAATLTKRLASADVTIVDAAAGRINIVLQTADTDGLSGDLYYEVSLLPGPVTTHYGCFRVTADSAPDT